MTTSSRRTAYTQHPPGGQRPTGGERLADSLGQTVLDALGDPPRSTLRPAHPPGPASRRIARIACTKAGLVAGTLALPVGPAGWLTLLPEMAAVWKVQARMVADIAALHGHTEPPSAEELLYCLFRHATGQLVRDLVVRVGERSMVQTASLQALRLVATRIGTRLAERLASKGLARWVPVAGAVGIGAYAYWDTRQVAATATELFASQRVALDAPS